MNAASSAAERYAADVLIKIAYVGICHSDIHNARDDWSPGTYPMVPGHEIAGIVTEVGSAVTTFKPGDRVGVGCFVDSCGACDACRSGEEQFCNHKTMTYNSKDGDGNITYGGYSTHIVVREPYVLRIPDTLSPESAAPLPCAGITTYSPLRHYRPGPGRRVAVIGMGGLGHMAVQYAHAMGADVTVISQTRAKEADGRRFGASDYRAMSEPDTLKALRGSFDLIINTVSADLDITALLHTLRLDGTLVFVGLPVAPQAFQVSALTSRRRSIAGSNIGGIRETQEMLDFSAAHGITAQVEVITADEVTEAYDRVVESAVRYRFVIDAATI
ncbi:NAD(P)-dependent alcohol dehydrogenase [Enteractinococcus coprophilus]|uniref:alcohol dehydrogenase (NADP(+)) n=1 Tax=Enteractinococcus coprophilus TaxID=1027633 RepID=A0A543AIW6_9MICC|nr:NAD(P)-dependent alcohol dehydrogenase [Enteractinococcus coprophilus]TQL72466.1 putative zinc-type alcohol dehydrogenase-like protein [Enteractinococcus coprophilus]